MASVNGARRVIYPSLGARVDLWFARLSGHGLGNSFYSYFHAVVLADELNVDVIAPPWISLKFGPILRGDATNRLYIGMFKPYPGEVHGIRKLWLLALGNRERKLVDVGNTTAATTVGPGITAVSNRNFTFEGLHAHRDAIRERLLGIIRAPIPAGHTWGKSDYVAVHVRLGDFAVAADTKSLTGTKDNLRIPLSWYVKVASTLKLRYPNKPLVVFSDGKDHELKALTDLGATCFRSGSDVIDLLAMSAASLLVGSHSTYSRWAAFLGNMPSIWVEKTTPPERPTDPRIPLLYVPIDAVDIDLWPDTI